MMMMMMMMLVLLVFYPRNLPFKFGHNPDSNRRNIVVVVVDPTNLSLKLG